MTQGGDDTIRMALEGLARNIDRRSFLRRAMRVGFASAVAAAAGSLGMVGQVLAVCGACTFPFGRSCGSLGYGCPGAGGCPSGCQICQTAQCPTYCGYASGWWYSCGCGTCGLGCHKCYDCTCPAGAQGCNGACGCRSTQCYCCQCCTPQDIQRELGRISAAA